MTVMQKEPVLEVATPQAVERAVVPVPGGACLAMETWPRVRRPLRILEVVNDFPPTLGGSETHNTSEVDFLARRGHSVCILAVRDMEAMASQRYDEETRRLLRRSQWTWSSEHRIPVYETADPGRSRVWPLVRMHRRLSRLHGPFDVVVVHRSHYLPAFAFSRRLILTLHYMELVCPSQINPARCHLKPDRQCECYRKRSFWKNVKWRVRQRLSDRLMDAVVTKYSHIAEKLNYAGLSPRKIHCVPNWIDSSSFGGRNRPWPGMPEDHPQWIRSGGPIFVYLGRLDAFHQPLLALRGFALAARECHSARLVYVGDGQEMPGLREQVDALGLKDRVRFLGRVNREYVPAALSWCDAGMATSDQDNYCWSLLEMMAAGLPVAATEVGGTCHVLRDGRNGYLAKPTAEGIAEVIRRIVRDPALSRNVGAEARATIEREYSRGNLLRYEAILAGTEVE